MRDFLLDTNTIRYWYDTECPEHSAVISNVNALRVVASGQHPEPKFVISVISLGEINFGLRVQKSELAAHSTANRKFVEEQLPTAWDVTADATEAYGELRARLFDRYAPGAMRKSGKRPEQLINPATALSLQIQENDLWICAQAVAHGFVLVTNDRMRAIREVSGSMQSPLLLQNWTLPNTAVLVN